MIGNSAVSGWAIVAALVLLLSSCAVTDQTAQETGNPDETFEPVSEFPAATPAAPTAGADLSERSTTETTSTPFSLPDRNRPVLTSSTIAPESVTTEVTTTVTTVAPPAIPAAVEDDLETTDRRGVPAGKSPDELGVWKPIGLEPGFSTTRRIPNSGNGAHLGLNFDSLGSLDFGDVSREAIEDALGVKLRYLANDGDLSVVPHKDGFSLRQRYVPNHRGSAVTEFLTESGSVDGSDEMWLSYRVLFEPGWEWVKGGKLPGLAGGDYPSGGGGADGTDGFSARLMWRPDGQIVVYAYHPDRPSRFGEDFPLCSDVAIGQWVQITQRVVMNSSADSRDGGIEVWIDGQLALSRLDMRWRTTGDFDIDTLSYSSFYGGASRDWAPSKTTYAQFDDFKMARTPAGIDWTYGGDSPDRSWIAAC